jgi:hypothetical protein
MAFESRVPNFGKTFAPGGRQGSEESLAHNSGKYSGGPTGFFALLFCLPRTRWPKHKRSLRGCHVATCAVVCFQRGSGLLRRAALLGYQERLLAFLNAGIAWNSHGRRDLVDRDIYSQIAARGELGRTTGLSGRRLRFGCGADASVSEHAAPESLSSAKCWSKPWI